MRKHSNNRLFSYKKRERICWRNCNICKPFRIWILLQTCICKYKCSVCTHIAIRNYHQEECGYQLCTRFRLQDLKARTKCICCRMACSWYHTVSIPHLHHHYPIIKVIIQKQLFCLLRCHTFLLSQFNQFCNITFCSCICSRIYDRSTGDIICTFIFLNLLFASNKHQISNSFF